MKRCIQILIQSWWSCIASILSANSHTSLKHSGNLLLIKCKVCNFTATIFTKSYCKKLRLISNRFFLSATSWTNRSTYECRNSNFLHQNYTWTLAFFQQHTNSRTIICKKLMKCLVVKLHLTTVLFLVESIIISAKTPKEQYVQILWMPLWSQIL